MFNHDAEHTSDAFGVDNNALAKKMASLAMWVIANEETCVSKIGQKILTSFTQAEIALMATSFFVNSIDELAEKVGPPRFEISESQNN